MSLHEHVTAASLVAFSDAYKGHGYGKTADTFCSVDASSRLFKKPRLTTLAYLMMEETLPAARSPQPTMGNSNMSNLASITV